jgi:hypothetical protein
MRDRAGVRCQRRSGPGRIMNRDGAAKDFHAEGKTITHTSSSALTANVDVDAQTFASAGRLLTLFC